MKVSDISAACFPLTDMAQTPPQGMKVLAPGGISSVSSVRSVGAVKQAEGRGRNVKYEVYPILLPLYFAAALFAALLLTGNQAQAADAAEQQRDAINHIDSFVDYFRKTGDFKSRVVELTESERKLSATVEMFVGRGDLASAALSLIKLGQIQRMQGKWDAALQYYRQAETTARKAKHAAHQAKALIGQAQSEDGLRDYGSAERHALQAITLATALTDKTFLFDALDIQAQVNLKQGNFNAAAENLNRAFELPGISDELTFYALLDRGDVYLKIAEQCDYQRNFDACLQAVDHTKDDYRKALAIARKLGWTGLAKQIEKFLSDADMRAELINLQRRSQEDVQKAKVFHPEKPANVLITEHFVGSDLHMPPEMIQLYQQSKQFEAMAGGFGNSVAGISFYTDGLMRQSQGDHAGALVYFYKAIEVLEQDRRKLQDDKSRASFVENKLGAYYAAIKELLDQHRHAEAFELMERSRARAMADILASRHLDLYGETEQKLYAESVRLKTDIGTRQAELFRRINGGARPESIAPLSSRIGELQEAHARLIARISAEAPKLLELTASRPVTLRALQAQMKQDGFAALEYLVTETSLIVWYIDT